MTISETAVAARKCGMSYGQYVAQTRVVVVRRPAAAVAEKRAEEKQPQAKKKKCRKKIVATCIETGNVKRYWSILDAVRDGFIYHGVEKCLDGVQKTHMGWTFKRSDA